MFFETPDCVRLALETSNTRWSATASFACIFAPCPARSPTGPFIDNNEPFRIGGKFTLRDPEQAEKAAKTVPLNISFAFPLPPLPLTPGCTYRWILEAQDKEVASVAFTVRTEPSAV